MTIFDDFKRYHNSNYHDGDSHFDERTYKKSNGDDFDCQFIQDCYDHFEAGTASRQAEIDALKNKIQTALNKACMLQNSSGERIYIELEEILND